jgi:hypothetical protein
MAWQTPVVSSATSYFNYTDWNRIEGNCVALSALFQTCGYTVALTTVTSRADGSYLDFYDSINRIEGNILALYACYSITPSGWITPKTTWTFDQSFSFADTNRMEGNTLALYNLVNGIIQEYVVCGQSLAICGLTWNN